MTSLGFFDRHVRHSGESEVHTGAFGVWWAAVHCTHPCTHGQCWWPQSVSSVYIAFRTGDQYSPSYIPGSDCGHPYSSGSMRLVSASM